MFILTVLIYQINALSYSIVTSCAFFILSSVIYYIVHIAIAMNQNYLGSSLPTPLNISIFIVFYMLNGGGGGGGGGEGVSVCGGGGGGI